jgi:hypothetical protein
MKPPPPYLRTQNEKTMTHTQTKISIEEQRLILEATAGRVSKITGQKIEIETVLAIYSKSGKIYYRFFFTSSTILTPPFIDAMQCIFEVANSKNGIAILKHKNEQITVYTYEPIK